MRTWFYTPKKTHTKKKQTQKTKNKKKKTKKKQKNKKTKKKQKKQKNKNKKNSRILANEYNTLVRLLFRYLDYYYTVLLIIFTFLNPTFIL